MLLHEGGQVRARIRERVAALCQQARSYWDEVLSPKLAHAGVHVWAAVCPCMIAATAALPPISSAM